MYSVQSTSWHELTLLWFFFVLHKAKQVLAFQWRLHAIDPNYLRSRPVAAYWAPLPLSLLFVLFLALRRRRFPNLGSMKSICSTQFYLALGSATRVHAGWRPLQSPRSPQRLRPRRRSCSWFVSCPSSSSSSDSLWSRAASFAGGGGSLAPVIDKFNHPSKKIWTCFSWAELHNGLE